MTQSLSHSQAQLARHPDFAGRVASILKDEGYSPVGVDPLTQALTIVHDVAAQPGIADAFHASILAERTDGATADDVITDGALLSGGRGRRYRRGARAVTARLPLLLAAAGLLIGGAIVCGVCGTVLKEAGV